MKRIMIVGDNSYISRSFQNWINQYKEKYEFKAVSSKNYEWMKADFTSYDVVIDFAGIAHIKNITDDMKNLFYSVNRDLSIEIATCAKQQGVKHFVIFSSMNVYGDYVDNLSDRSAVRPSGFYGDSKLQGDIGIRKLEDDNFTVSYLRPPFVYGKGCSGNYNTISSIAKRTPIFPTYENKKSMIYVDNLCEFLCMVIDERLGGILTPQNKELISTSKLVREIARVNNHRVVFTGAFNWAIKFGKKLSKNVRRAFANDCYDPAISNYWNYKYCVVNFEESIKRTEQ